MHTIIITHKPQERMPIRAEDKQVIFPGLYLISVQIFCLQ